MLISTADSNSIGRLFLDALNKDMTIEILQIGLPKLDLILKLLKLYIKDFYLFLFFCKTE